MCNNAELEKAADDADSTCIICENKFTCHRGVPQRAEETDGLYLCDLACLICGEPLDQSAYFEHPGVGGNVHYSCDTSNLLSL